VLANEAKLCYTSPSGKGKPTLLNLVVMQQHLLNCGSKMRMNKED
jgi:hypothetical protein